MANIFDILGEHGVDGTDWRAVDRFRAEVLPYLSADQQREAELALIAVEDLEHAST